MHPCRQPRVPRRIAAVALLALLLAQWSALVHAIAHGPGYADSRFVETASDAWGHPAESSACQLFDRLFTGHAPGFDAAPASAVLPVVARARQPAPEPDTDAGYRTAQARGPPRG